MNGTENGEKYEVVECLAGSGRKFRKCQIRVKGGMAHIQAEGVPVNRHYGVAVDINLPIDAEVWLNNQEHSEPSLANTGAMYVPAQFIPLSNLEVQVQVKGEKFNRDYGLTFKVVSPELTLLYNNVSVYDDVGIPTARLDVEEP